SSSAGSAVLPPFSVDTPSLSTQALSTPPPRSPQWNLLASPFTRRSEISMSFQTPSPIPVSFGSPSTAFHTPSLSTPDGFVYHAGETSSTLHALSPRDGPRDEGSFQTPLALKFPLHWHSSF
ncbi:unnamed protein product, partial [Arabidopsis halleri]